MTLTNPLSRPTLEQVKTLEIGKFFEIESDGNRTIKTTTHPRWFEDVKHVQQMTLYISEEVSDLLKKDGTVSGRWTNKKPKWISKHNSKTGKAQFLFYVRTPKGKSKYVDIHTLKRYRDPKSKIGRPPSGMAYKLRREAWRALENPKFTVKLLKNKELFEQERGKTKPISIRLPDLSLALKELLFEEFINKLEPSDYHILDKWNKYRDVNQDILERGLILQYSIPNELGLFIEIVTENQWKAILARMIEIRVLDKHAREISSKNKTEINIFETTVYEIDDPTQFSCKECGSLNWKFEHKENIKYCGNCGVVVLQLLDSDEEVMKRKV